MTLVALAPGKVNLCLYVGPARDDGLHELVSLVQSLSLADELALAPTGGDADRVECPGVEGDNLAAAALAAFRAEAGWDGPPQLLSIVKRVPVAAGMGGGSGDAAAALRLAARAAGLDGDAAARLAAVAFGLGADVPAQLAPGLSLVTGAGEEVTPVAERAPFGVVLITSEATLSTPDVYREADRLGTPRSAAGLAERRAVLEAALADGDSLPPAELLVNDLEPAARSLLPAVGDAIDDLRAAGAAAALVSGSGPTAFGIFPGIEGPGLAAAAAAELLERNPGAIAAVAVDPAFAAVHEDAAA